MCAQKENNAENDGTRIQADREAELDRVKKLLLEREMERKQISRELHDSIAGSMLAVKMHLEHLLRITPKNTLPTRELETLLEIVENNLAELRIIMKSLHRNRLEQDLCLAINRHCRIFKQIHPRIDVKFNMNMEESAIPDCLKPTLLRVIQEASTNAAKHSRADILRIDLFKTECHLFLQVEDNGCGVEMESAFASGGLGLVGMRERVETAGGIFSFSSVPNAGTRIQTSWQLSSFSA